MSLYTSLKQDCLRILQILAIIKDKETIVKSVMEPATENPDVLVAWDTKENCRHNVRVLADLEGLTEDQKNKMSQTIHCESDYDINCVHPNVVKRPDGTTYVASTDNGICQWNDYYHASEITPDEALHNPEMAVRLMCKYVKAGLLKEWVCYQKNMYESYSA